MRLLFLLLLLLICIPAYAAAPCLKATSDCTQWVNLGSESRSMVYSTYPLDKKNDQIVRALIVVHGQGRDADNYFRTSLAAAFLANAFNDTIVISPRLASNNGTGCKDTLAAGEVNWPCGGDSWRSGGTATNNAKLTSYDFMDEIVRELANKNNFPNLKAIVISGHSAGGQFVTRYEMGNKIHETISVLIAYVVSNPSSYSHLDSARPAGPNNELRPFGDARNCTTYDSWPYGLKNRTGYTANIPDDQLKKQLASRPVTYLLGELDVLPLAGFDSSCPAMAQGPTRDTKNRT